MARAPEANATAAEPRSLLQRPAVAALALVATTVLAYANSLRVPFVFDDEYSILRNPTLASFAHAWSPPGDAGFTVGGRPLLNVSLALNHAISGSATWSYHALNLAIHVGSALLLFGIVRRTLRTATTTLPFLIALLWALHPLQTESVTYTVQRAESLMGFFFLLTLYAFIRAVAAVVPTVTTRWQWTAFLACLAGMATKEVMVVAPLVVVLYDRLFIASSWREVWLRRRGIHLALGCTWVLLLGLVFASGNRGGTFNLGDPHAWWRYDLTQCVAVIRYLALTWWPQPLVIDYGTFWVEHPADVALEALLILALVVATFAALVRSRATPAWGTAGFLGACFFLCLAPSSLPPGNIQMIVEHRMYLPLAALLVAIALAAHFVLGRRVPFLIVGGAIAFGLIARARNEDYASPIRLFEKTVAQRPRNARAMALLADYERRAGRLDDARQWLEHSLAVEPNVVPVLNNLGDVWQELGEPAKAVACFQQSLARHPNDVHTLNNLGNALILSGHPVEGIAQLQLAAKLKPGDVTTRLNLANGFARAGQFAEAAAEFDAVLKLYPDNIEAHATYASLLQEAGRRDEAVVHLQTAVRLRPSDAELHDRLGAALGRAGRLREALAEFESALRLNPEDQIARQNAALARRRLGED